MPVSLFMKSCSLLYTGMIEAGSKSKLMFHAQLLKGVTCCVLEADPMSLHTSPAAVSAVQVLKIRRPNYSDFSVKTMVIMKLLQ